MALIVINTFEDIKKIKPSTTVKTYSVGKGNSLYVKCRSIKDGGKLSYVRRYRHPLNKSKKEMISLLQIKNLISNKIICTFFELNNFCFDLL